MISWTRAADGTISGTLQDAEASDLGAADPVKSSSASVTGNIVDSSVTIRVGGDVGGIFGATFTGTLRGKALDLNVPQSDGQVQTITLAESSVADYNQAVARIRDLSNADRSAASAAASTAASASAAAEAQAALERAEKDLQSALDTLDEDIASLRSSVADLKMAVRDMKKAVDAQYGLFKKAEAASCEDFAAAQSDEEGGSSDVAGVSSTYDGTVLDYESAVDRLDKSLGSTNDLVTTVKDGGGQLPDLTSVRTAKAAGSEAGSAKKAADKQVKALLVRSEHIDTDTRNLNRC